MFSHLFLLNNNKYFIIYNDDEYYSLLDAINEFSKHEWILHNNQHFIKLLKSDKSNTNTIIDNFNIYGINNIRSNIPKYDKLLIPSYIISRIFDNNIDRWSSYGSNHSQRLKNRISSNLYACY
jgi:hypothetical protein